MFVEVRPIETPKTRQCMKQAMRINDNKNNCFAIHDKLNYAAFAKHTITCASHDHYTSQT